MYAYYYMPITKLLYFDITSNGLSEVYLYIYIYIYIYMCVCVCVCQSVYLYTAVKLYHTIYSFDFSIYIIMSLIINNLYAFIKYNICI